MRPFYFCWIGHGFWFRLYGYGLWIKRTKYHQPLFSERYGWRKRHQFLGFTFEFLKAEI